MVTAKKGYPIYDARHSKVKLQVLWPGLAGKVVSFYIVPLAFALKGEACRGTCRSGKRASLKGSG